MWHWQSDLSAHDNQETVERWIRWRKTRIISCLLNSFAGSRAFKTVIRVDHFHDVLHKCQQTEKNGCSQGNCVLCLVADTLVVTGLGGRTVWRMSYGCTAFLSFSGQKTILAREEGFGNVTGSLCSTPSHRLTSTLTQWWALHEISDSHSNEC